MPEISITATTIRILTKEELIDAIRRNFLGPDYCEVAVLTTVVARDETNLASPKIVQQSITFSKKLEV